MSTKSEAVEGYHIMDIPRGNYGELSKVFEEFMEVKDAETQGVRIMTLVELSDLYGAIVGYLEAQFPGFTMDDLQTMSAVTHRAFRSGARKPRD